MITRQSSHRVCFIHAADVGEMVAILRSEKKIDSEISFSAYFDQITELIDLDKQVDVMIPSLEEFKKKERKSQLQTWGSTWHNSPRAIRKDRPWCVIS